MKKDKLMKKKFPDYKVAYVTLVCTVLVFMYLGYSTANISNSQFKKCSVLTCVPSVCYIQALWEYFANILQADILEC